MSGGLLPLYIGASLWFTKYRPASTLPGGIVSGNVKDAWNYLLDTRRLQLVGGDILHLEPPEGAFRGPINSIQIEAGRLVVTTEWTAHTLMSSYQPVGKWTLWREGQRFVYNLNEVPGRGLTTSPPSDIGEGCICFTALFDTVRVTLFPRGGNKLDPANVVGL
jgi:hypothetical protein